MKMYKDLCFALGELLLCRLIERGTEAEKQISKDMESLISTIFNTYGQNVEAKAKAIFKWHSLSNLN